ncbi:MAG: c-type cytochrome [Pirellulales bacterium]
MKHLVLTLACWLSLVVALRAAGDPALPGDHPLTPPQVGQVLLAELRCAACHRDIPLGALPERTAPDLADVGARVAPEFLRKFLASAQAVHPGSTMPDMLAGRSAADRESIAEALTHFLVAQSRAPFGGESTTSADREWGKTLYHTVGCVACHGPREMPTDTPSASPRPEDDEEDEDPRVKAKRAIKPIAIPLGHVASKYSAKSLGEFLFQPLRVRRSGRMPDMKLTPDESSAIASYLLGEQPPSAQPLSARALTPQPPFVAKGKQYFQELNCAACHTLSGIVPTPPALSLKQADLSRGCLSGTPGRSPRFQLEPAQVNAIRAALRAAPAPDSDQVAVAQSLTAFRCIACHVRDDYGGVPEAYSLYFSGSEQKLGEDGRIPPPLTLVGAKLQPAWMKRVLFDGESVRHYMTTRMPQYGEPNLRAFPAVLARLDVLTGRDLKIPTPESRSESEREREKLLRAAGRELLGDKGLNCVSCHVFNGKAAPGTQGIDLLTTFQRLQPGWYDAYLRNPNAFRPRTVMPTAWPNGMATHKTILDGNTDLQIDAIWYYLSLGTSAADPSGIRGVSTKITVDSQAKTYRGRSRVAGFRGIAVGLPEKLSYAFNAETGTLTTIWQGEFIGVNWSGQGSGDFHPLAEPITLAQDVSFARLDDDQAPWPLLPVMTKEARTNPDPLYPKHLGYQFRGYELDESFVPTFKYRSGSLEIEDRSVAVVNPERSQLKRILRIASPNSQQVWFRALTGEIHQESNLVYRSGRLRLTIPPTAAILRASTGEPPQSELLLKLTLPAGTSTLEFHYEPLKK